jgi:hypothetical protein
MMLAVFCRDCIRYVSAADAVNHLLVRVPEEADNWSARICGGLYARSNLL